MAGREVKRQKAKGKRQNCLSSFAFCLLNNLSRVLIGGVMNIADI